ncbi:MAG: AAA family ATPase [Candidatus Heimdallarchaeota archaeon]|nr:AAA family ATPase [Candidatus Heimdallarchaeota archaeon]
MVSLKIIKSTTEDFGKGIARVSPMVMKQYNYSYDEIIEVISQNKRTGVKIRPFEANLSDGLQTDEMFKDKIMLDGLTRTSISTSIDSVVRIDKTISQPAEKVSIIPLNPTIMSKSLQPSQFSSLIGNPLTVLDIIAINATEMSTDLSSNYPVEDGKSEELIINSVENDNNGNTQTLVKQPLTGSVLGEFRFLVQSTYPTGIVVINEQTEFVIGEKIDRSTFNLSSNILTYDDIGGYGDIIRRLHELVVIPLRNPELFQRLNIDFPRGILITGPSGIGKSLLARVVSIESGAYIVNIHASEIVSGQFGEAEKRVKKYFREAIVNKPAVIVIDDLHTVAPERNPMTTTELSRRLTSEFLKQIDNIPLDDPVLILATSNSPEQVDVGFKRPGRFDHEISLSPPDKNEREEILMVKTRGVPISSSTELEELADRTRGYSGADLNMLVKEAALASLRRILPSLEGSIIPQNVLNALVLNQEDFNEALKFVNPSAIKEIFTDIPNVTWDDIGGLVKVKLQIKESVQWPLQNPEIFSSMGVRPPTGVLLFGPPGTGKTLLAKAIANETSSNFIAVKGPELNSKWFGETERAIREIFRKARQLSPCLIFFDEIDSMIRIRGASNAEPWIDRMINQFLTEMDGIDRKGRIIVVGATNRPELMDPAILRPGRFDRLIYVPTPDVDARREIFKVHTKNMKLNEDVKIDTLVAKTDYFVGADIENVCREAAILSLREDLKNTEVRHEHFMLALEESQPTMSKQTVEYFDNLSKNLRGNVTRRENLNYRDYFS